MEKWEYWTGILNAHIDNQGVREYLKKKWPNWKPEKYAPQTMMPQLNEMGNAGWELVLMVPISTGSNSDFAYPTVNYNNTYFCAFKRKVQ